MADFWCPNFPMMVTNLITKYYPRAPNASSPPTWKHPIGWAVWKRSIQHFVAMVLSKWGRNVIVGLFCNVLQPDLVVDRPPAQKISLLVKFLVTKVAYCNKKSRKNKKVFQFDSLSKTFGFSCVVIFVKKIESQIRFLNDLVFFAVLSNPLVAILCYITQRKNRPNSTINQV